MFLRLSAFLLAVLPAFGVSVTDPRWPRIRFEFSAGVEPTGGISGDLPGGVKIANGRVYRIIQDAKNKTYFGYDVVLDGSPSGERFQIRVEPLSTPPESVGMHPAWKKLSLPGSSAIADLRVGATAKFDLLMNPATGEKIVDSITIIERGRDRTPPRDFAVTDAVLHFDRPELIVDGAAIGSSGGMTGVAVWFYTPDRGRFVLSLVPHPGFQRMGEVTDTRLTVKDESAVYEIHSRNSIAPGEGTFYIYVRHDRGWRPRGDDAKRLLLGAADNPDWIR